MNCGEKLKYENSLGFEMDVDFTYKKKNYIKNKCLIIYKKTFIN